MPRKNAKRFIIEIAPDMHKMVKDEAENKAQTIRDYVLSAIIEKMQRDKLYRS